VGVRRGGCKETETEREMREKGERMGEEPGEEVGWGGRTMRRKE